MKNGSSNKRRIIIVVVIAALILTGYIFRKPVLKNAEKPFIELSGSVGNAIGNAKNAYDAEHPAPTTEPAPPEPETEPPTTESETADVDVDIEIVVCDESISTDEATYKDVNGFIEAFNHGVFEEKNIILVDDYAEAKTFKRLINLFEEAGISYEIERR